MANSRDRSWIVPIVLAVAGAFGLLGLCFVVAPRTGAALFGIRAESGPAAAYVRAIGFRDLTLCVYISALSLWSSRRSLSIVLGATVIIPICDLVLIVSVVGLTWHLIVHAASAACFTALAFLVRPLHRTQIGALSNGGELRRSACEAPPANKSSFRNQREAG
jgi:hypothetical protein